MADEHEVPVKVVDRRWWARADEPAADPAAPRQDSRKPTYIEDLERQLAEKDRQLQEVLVKYRQASQEFEDGRARVRKELAKDAERSRREVLVGLLEVVDNLDRAIEAAVKAGASDSDPLFHGVQLVRRQFLAKLETFSVFRLAAADTVFDPELHEAVSVVPSADAAQDGRVVGVVRQGYRIGDEVLRPALVAVGKAGGQAAN